MNSAILLGAGCGILTGGLTWLILTLGKNRIGVSREVVVGATSSILAAIIIWVGVNVFSGLILPWYHEHAYKGIDLSGKWHIKLGDSGEVSRYFEMMADLKQVTDRVSGILVVVFKDDSDKRPRTYNLSGFRRDQFLAITIEKISRKHIGLGTSLVETVGIGNSLRGYLCAYDASTGKIRCDSCEWTRADEED
jgi:hypothetical protein